MSKKRKKWNKTTTKRHTTTTRYFQTLFMINKDVFFLSSLRIEIHIFHIRCAVCTGITGYAMQLPAVYVVQYIFLFLNFSMNLFNFVHVSCVSVYFILFFVGVWYAFFPFFVCRSVAYFLVSLFLMIMNFVFVFAYPPSFFHLFFLFRFVSSGFFFSKFLLLFLFSCRMFIVVGLVTA